MRWYEPSIKENKMTENISDSVCKELYCKWNRANVFTTWDREKYMRGNKGDYLACRKDDLQDVHIIGKDIFAKTYEAKQ